MLTKTQILIYHRAKTKKSAPKKRAKKPAKSIKQKEPKPSQFINFNQAMLISLISPSSKNAP